MAVSLIGEEAGVSGEKHQSAARNQDNVSEWGDMSTSGVLFQ
jgi:hypothetical protein